MSYGRSRLFAGTVFRTCIGLAVLAGAVSSAAARDEDDRKLLDKQPAVRAPIYRAAFGGAPGGPDGPFESQAVNLLSWIPLSAFPNSQGNGSDCWGYVSPSGREYAIIGLQKGFGVVEVSNPANAQIIGYVPGATSTWHDVKVIGNYAYGVSEGGLGIQVINLSQVDAGVVTHVGNVMTGGHTSTHNIAANPASGFLYLCGANISNGGLVAISTANPASPAIVGAWNTRYVHDAQVVTYTSGPYAGKEIAFCANGGAGLDVLDVTNKSNMVRIGGAGYPQLSYCHQAWLSEDKQYLYVDDELDEQNFGINTNTRVFDVSNPASPVLIGTFSSGLPAIDHNLYVHNGLIFQANYRSGLRVFDATSSPTNPTQIAWFDTYPGSNSASFNGAWSCYPFFPSGTVLISDIERGLFVVRVGGLGFTFPSGTPSIVAPNVATAITVDVAEQFVNLNASSVRLHYRVNGSNYSEVAMSALGNNQFTANLPASACFSVLDYYVSAMTTGGETFTSPPDAPASAYSAQVLTGTQVVYSDPFETNQGWTVQNTNLSTGAWERVDPIGTNNGGTPAQPEDDYDNPGTMCYITGQGAVGGAVGAADVDGGPTNLLSPTLDLSGQPEARISYARWFYTSTGEDPFTVEVSNNNGSTWAVVSSITGGGGGWVVEEFRVADFVTPNAQVRVRFSTMDNPNNSIVEAGVDAFKISAPQCAAPCYADCNGDSMLNLADFGCFQTKFATQDPYADCNGDSMLNLADFGCFQTKFAIGCP